jgi:hypothetical protein
MRKKAVQLKIENKEYRKTPIFGNIPLRNGRLALELMITEGKKQKKAGSSDSAFCLADR